jgi:hypothetical protein
MIVIKIEIKIKRKKMLQKIRKNKTKRNKLMLNFYKEGLN